MSNELNVTLTTYIVLVDLSTLVCVVTSVFTFLETNSIMQLSFAQTASRTIKIKISKFSTADIINA